MYKNKTSKRDNPKSFVKGTLVGLLAGVTTGIGMMYALGYNKNIITTNAWESRHPSNQVVKEDRGFTPVGDLKVGDYQVLIQDDEETKESWTSLKDIVEKSYRGSAKWPSGSRSYLIAGPLKRVASELEKKELNSNDKEVWDEYIKGKFSNGGIATLSEAVDALLIYADQNLGNKNLMIENNEIEAVINELYETAKEVGPNSDIIIEVDYNKGLANITPGAEKY